MSDFVRLEEALRAETKNKSAREIRWMIRASKLISLLYNPSFFYLVLSFTTFFMSVILYGGEQMLRIREVVFFVVVFHLSFLLALFLFRPLDTREEHEKFKAVTNVLGEIYYNRFGAPF